MKIDAPAARHIPALRALWKEAFGDADDFLDIFFSTAFSPDRCRCVLEDDTPVAVLYWFDHSCAGQKYAYLYAVATKKSHRRRGLCRLLMEQTHQELTAMGYAGALLVPESDALARYYAAMGYRFCASHTAFTALPGADAADLRPVTPEEYARLRSGLLPENSAVPDRVSMAFLSCFTCFYAGEDLLFAAQRIGDRLFVPELLGNAHAAPEILTALGASSGTFRTPGDGTPFAMCLPLDPGAAIPRYLPFAFD